MDSLDVSTGFTEFSPLHSASSGVVDATCDLPPSLRHLVHALLARARTASLEAHEVAPVRALLHRRRGDDADRLEASHFARVARGDGGAFAWVEARYATALRLMATRVRAASVDDALQAARVKLWLTADRFDPARGSVAAWVLAVARYALLDAERKHCRWLRRRARAEPLLVAEGTVEPDRDDPEDFERAAVAVAGLDPPFRAVLLASANDQSHAEIAAALGLPIGTVKSRVRRAQQLLRAALDATG